MNYDVEYPLCDRCINYENISSSIFGSCYVCKIENNKFVSAYDNDWYVEDENKPPVMCPFYIKGEPTQYCLG